MVARLLEAACTFSLFLGRWNTRYPQRYTYSPSGRTHLESASHNYLPTSSCTVCASNMNRPTAPMPNNSTLAVPGRRRHENRILACPGSGRSAAKCVLCINRSRRRRTRPAIGGHHADRGPRPLLHVSALVIVP